MEWSTIAQAYYLNCMICDTAVVSDNGSRIHRYLKVSFRGQKGGTRAAMYS